MIFNKLHIYRIHLFTLAIFFLAMGFFPGVFMAKTAHALVAYSWGDEQCGSSLYTFTIGNYQVTGCVGSEEWSIQTGKDIEYNIQFYGEKAISKGYSEAATGIGCVNATYVRAVLFQCVDGIDNDGNGLIDYPNDPGCSIAADNSESGFVSQCSDGIDNDGNGVVDYPDDQGCSSANDNNESGWVPECSDGIDNDGNGLVDFPNDPGCSSASDNSESGYVPQCSDGIDNDGDGLIDYPNDPGCDSPTDNDESGELYTHWNVGAWNVCTGYNPETGQGGTQTRTVTSFTNETCCDDQEPASTRSCDLPADYDLYDVSGGNPNDIANTFSVYVTFIGDQQVKFSSSAQIGVSPVFINHPNQPSVTFSVTDVSPALPAGTEYFFTPQVLTPSGYFSGTDFKVKVPKTSPGVYQIGVKAEGGGIVKQGTVFLNVNVVNPTFQEI